MCLQELLWINCVCFLQTLANESISWTIIIDASIGRTGDDLTEDHSITHMKRNPVLLVMIEQLNDNLSAVIGQR